jgi:GNAT superfamily N-acetyltransferase
MMNTNMSGMSPAGKAMFQMMVAKLNGDETIGYIVLTLGDSLEYHGRDAFVDEIYIRESHRGKGIGAQAIKFVEGGLPPARCASAASRSRARKYEGASVLSQNRICRS